MADGGYFKKNPIRWLLHGDYNDCMAYRGEATKLLWQLKNAIELGGLQQHVRTRFFQDGTIIRVASHFGQDTIQIQVPPVITPPPEPPIFPKVLYTADSYNHKIVALNPQTGKVLFDFGEEGTGDGQFKQPYALHGFKNELYIVDFWIRRVQVFNYKGIYQRKWGDELFAPNHRGICAYKGTIYVCSPDDRITAYTTTGQIIRWVGEVNLDLSLRDLTVYKDRVYTLQAWGALPPFYKIEVRHTNLDYITTFDVPEQDNILQILELDVLNNEIYLCGSYFNGRNIQDGDNTIYFDDAWIGIYDLDGHFKRQFFAPLDNWQLWDTTMVGCFVYRNEIFAIFYAIGPYPHYDQWTYEIHVYSLGGQLLRKFTNVLGEGVEYRPINLFIDRGDI